MAHTSDGQAGANVGAPPFYHDLVVPDGLTFADLYKAAQYVWDFNLGAVPGLDGRSSSWLRCLRQAGALISVGFCVICWSTLDEFWGMCRSESLRDAKIGAESHEMGFIKEVSEPHSAVYPELRLPGDKRPHVEFGAVITAISS
jgi:hypothetical protein